MRMMLRLPSVMQQLGLAESTIYARMKDGLLPRGVPLGPRAVGWPADEIDAITAARIAGKGDAEIRELVKDLITARSTAA